MLGWRQCFLECLNVFHQPAAINRLLENGGNILDLFLIVFHFFDYCFEVDVILNILGHLLNMVEHVGATWNI